MIPKVPHMFIIFQYFSYIFYIVSFSTNITPVIPRPSMLCLLPAAFPLDVFEDRPRGHCAAADQCWDPASGCVSLLVSLDISQEAKACDQCRSSCLGHVVAVRVVQMRNYENSSSVYTCDGQSRAWVVKPQSFVAVLALESFGEDISMFSATLSNESIKLVESTKCLEDEIMINYVRLIKI